MSKNFYVYKITNSINGKIYIGKTNNVKKRWEQHKTAAEMAVPNDYSYFHRAMKKHGFDNFNIETIAEFNTDGEALQAEIEFIKEYNSKNKKIGYNLTDGGDGAQGYKHTKESLQKMKECKQGMFIGENNPFYGKTHSEDTKNIISTKAKDNVANGLYDKSNLEQCSFSTNEAITIQQAYINGSTIEQLANSFQTNVRTIHAIIHGTYFSIRKNSIITEDMFNEIKTKRLKTMSLLYSKLSNEQEIEIVKYYKSGSTIDYLCKEYKVSSPTITKTLKKNGVVLIKRKRVNFKPSHASKLTEADIFNIKEKYKTGDFTYKEIGNEYGVLKQVIARIIQGRTFKN